MKISLIKNFSYSRNKQYTENKTDTRLMHTSAARHFQDYQIHFLGMPQIAPKNFTQKTYEEAVKYLQFRKDILGKPSEQLNLLSFDLTKLNGIQKGIKVFKGLSMKEIAFLTNELLGVTIFRGCSNRCAHCYANAVPQHFTSNSNMINQASYEDFKSFVDGIKELDKRLGIKTVKNSYTNTFVPFYDSDCIEIEMKDKVGKIYDFTDVNDIFFKSIGLKGIFDTTGWSPTSKKHQERAEKMLKYFLDPKNAKKMDQVAISINPFHGLNNKSIIFRNLNNEEQAKKFQRQYVERISNAIFTFTPLIGKPYFVFLVRAIKTRGYEGPYDKKALSELTKEILSNVEEMYKKDYASNRRYIKMPEQIDENLGILRKMLKKVSSISSSGRAKGLFAEHTGVIRYNESVEKNRLNMLKKRVISPFIRYYKTIDVNGKVWLVDFRKTVPTDIQLNYGNKNKLTVPLGDQAEDIKVTKEMIDRDF